MKKNRPPAHACGCRMNAAHEGIRCMHAHFSASFERMHENSETHALHHAACDDIRMPLMAFMTFEG